MSDVTLNRTLNIVLHLEDDAIVHSAPLSREAFDTNWRIFAKTWSMLEGEDIGLTAAPSVAAKALRQAAQESGDKDLRNANAVLAEIKRTASFMRPSEDSGYAPLPLNTAIQKNWIDEDDTEDVLNSLVFFTLASRVLPKQRRGFIFQFLPALRGAEMTSSDATAFSNSLQKSNKDASTGETAAAS